MFKNASPLYLSCYASLAIATILFLLLWSIQYFGLITIQTSTLLFIVFFIWLSGFVLIFFTIRVYIYRKIKLIYKNIQNFEVISQKKRASMQRGNFEMVEKDVSDWAASRQKEIDSLKSLEEYRKNYMGDISHELKTPIFNIQGYVHTLLDGGLFDESINIKYLKRAANNADRLYTIVEDLEAISKLESGELMLKYEVFDIKTLTLEVFDDLEMKSKKRAIHLNLKKEAAQSIKVKGDREKIRRVLINLIINSIKYGKKKGTTELGFYDMEDRVLIEVTDNGIGIEEKHLKHLFDRFYRVDKSRSRSKGASGLGLSIVKHIMEAHKQTIHVRSTTKVGSTFSFTLSKP